MRRLALAASLLLLAVPAAADDDCKPALRVAKESFELGQIDTITSRLGPCFDGKVDRADRTAAYALLARVFLAVDDENGARSALAAVLIFDPGWTPEPGLPPRFLRLLEEVRRSQASSRVASVSKTVEDLWEAPATAVVVTAEEIERRGYRDLEAVLHDLPGFDISRGNGDLYSNLYQRGFRSKINDRTLFLVDGVEQNDLASGAADLSRQYPMSNIDRIEVVYGPASTMYGANAYTGVINVITREPESYLGDKQRLAAELFAAGGTFRTGLAEATLAGRSRNREVAWSLTGRRFRSDELDLSSFADWDYRYDTVDYGTVLRHSGEFPGFRFGCRDVSPYYRVSCDEAGRILAIEPTSLAQRIARAADEQVARLHALAFSDRTDDWSVQGRLRTENLTAAFQVWRREEGTSPWSTDAFRGGAENGSQLTPRQMSFSLRYSRWLASNLWISSFTRYRQDDLDSSASSIASVQSFASGARDLTSLLRFCVSSFEITDPEKPLPLRCTSGGFVRNAFDQLSTQLANEVTWVYQPRKDIEAVGGVEVRKSSIQLGGQFGFGTGTSFQVPSPADHTDAGLYYQVSWDPAKRGVKSWAEAWRIVAGARLDYGEISGLPARDPILSPRLAVIYRAPHNFIFKAVHAQAFKEPTDFEKFSADSQSPIVRDANPNLAPERVTNNELIAAWRSKDSTVEVSAYQADYRDLVVLRQFGTFSSQFQNAGGLQVRGVQLSSGTRWRNLDISANYTYTSPSAIDPLGEDGSPLRDAQGRVVERLRVGDIASHRANVGVHVPLPLRCELDLRSNFVGARPTGAGTTVSTNPLSHLPAVVVVNTTLAWRAPLSGVTTRLTVDNLFNRRYADPGVQEAGAGFAARIPQPGRTVFLGFVYRPSSPL